MILLADALANLVAELGAPSTMGSVKRSPLRPVSDGKLREMRTRSRIRNALMADGLWRCEAGWLDACHGPLDMHERQSRGRGGSPTDRSNIVVVCRKHHDWAHANPEAAVVAGLLSHSWDDSS